MFHPRVWAVLARTRTPGLAPKGYGSTLEIDHIVSLELGGSNDIANLYPEEATLPANAPGFHVKDKLENKLHDLVCGGTMTLRSAQRQIATNRGVLESLDAITAPSTPHRSKPTKRASKEKVPVSGDFQSGSDGTRTLVRHPIEIRE